MRYVKWVRRRDFQEHMRPRASIRINRRVRLLHAPARTALSSALVRNMGTGMKRRNYSLAWLLIAISSQCHAATIITVTDNGDPVGAGTCPTMCSLRQAITAATAGDTIAFAPGLASPINLSQGELLIDKALTIAGPGATGLTVSAQNDS